MKQEFTFNLVLLFLINLLIKPLYIFGVEVEVQNRLGTELYGWYFHCFNIVFLLAVVNDPGILNWNAQHLPRHRFSADTHLAQLAGTKLLLALVFLAVSAFFVLLSGYDAYWLFLALAVNIIFSSAFMILRNSLASLGQYRTDSWLSGLDKLLMLLILGALLYVPGMPPFTLNGFLIGQLCATAMAVFTALLLLRRIVRPGWPTISLTLAWNMIRNSSPYLLILVFMTAYNRMDGILLGLLAQDPLYAAGIYAGAFRLYDAANMTGYLFASVLLPMYASHLDQRTILVELVNAGVKFSWLIGSLAVTTVFFFSEDILSFFYHTVDAAMLTSLTWLMLGYFFNAIGIIFGTLLVASGQVRSLNLVYGLGLVINLVMHLILIPSLGAVGAALTTCLTQLAVLLMQGYILRRQLDMLPSFKILRQGILYFILIHGFFYAICWLLPTPWWLQWLVSLIICVLLSFLLRLMEWEDVRIFLRRKSAQAG